MFQFFLCVFRLNKKQNKIQEGSTAYIYDRQKKKILNTILQTLTTNEIWQGCMEMTCDFIVANESKVLETKSDKSKTEKAAIGFCENVKKKKGKFILSI